MIKLHLDCGRNILDGWTNTDINIAKFRGSDKLDVTETFSDELNVEKGLTKEFLQLETFTLEAKK